MAISRCLELVYALIELGSTPTQNTNTKSYGKYPQVQIRLQNGIKGVAITAMVTSILPTLILCMIPASSFHFPSFISLLLLSGFMGSLSLVCFCARYVLTPIGRIQTTDTIAINGAVEYIFCLCIDVIGRIMHEPQVLLLVIMCPIFSWIWKSSLFLFVDTASTTNWTHFSTFVNANSIVSFISIMWIEKDLLEKPFVLDVRAAILELAQRDLVRSMRRALAAIVLAYIFLTYHARFAGLPEIQFHFLSSLVEHFTTLSTSSVFRVLIFQDTEQILEKSHPSRLIRQVRSTFINQFSNQITSFPEEMRDSTQLQEMHFTELRNRINGVTKWLEARKTSKTVNPEMLATEVTEFLEGEFTYSAIKLATQYDMEVRKQYFESATEWHRFFLNSTSIVDSFSISLQLFLAEPKGVISGNSINPGTTASAFAQFLQVAITIHPLLMLNDYSQLRKDQTKMTTSGIFSAIQLYFVTKLKNAIRLFITREAASHIFRQSKITQSCVDVLCLLASKSRLEDHLGHVKNTIPAILASLVGCRIALQEYKDMCTDHGNAANIEVLEAISIMRTIDRGIYQIIEEFYSELSTFQFPANTQKVINLFTSFQA